MQIFRVKRDYERGLWLKDHPHPVIDIFAANVKEAAERVCGTTLKDQGRAGEYRAKVWPLGRSATRTRDNALLFRLITSGPWFTVGVFRDARTEAQRTANARRFGRRIRCC
jgi:hypothetical protein